MRVEGTSVPSPRRDSGDVVSVALRGEATRLRGEAAGRLPAAESLLWRARLRARLEVAERATRVGRWYDRFAIVVGFLAGLGCLWVQRESVMNWFSGVLGAGPASSLPAQTDAALVALLIMAIAGLVVWLANLETPWASD